MLYYLLILNSYIKADQDYFFFYQQMVRLLLFAFC